MGNFVCFIARGLGVKSWFDCGKENKKMTAEKKKPIGENEKMTVNEKKEKCIELNHVKSDFMPLLRPLDKDGDDYVCPNELFDMSPFHLQSLKQTVDGRFGSVGVDRFSLTMLADEAACLYEFAVKNGMDNIEVYNAIIEMENGHVIRLDFSALSCSEQKPVDISSLKGLTKLKSIILFDLTVSKESLKTKSPDLKIEQGASYGEE